MKLKAQDAPYWESSEVALEKSVQDVMKLLDKHGCAKTAVQYGRDGRGARTVDFLWQLNDRSYVARFTTLTPGYESRRSAVRLTEMAEKQMGRIAWWYLKSMLVMVQYGHEEVMAPYLLQQGPRGSFTIQQQITDGNHANPAPWMLSNLDTPQPLALPANNDSADFTEVPNGPPAPDAGSANSAEV